MNTPTEAGSSGHVGDPPGGGATAGKVSIILFSGTADKFIAVGVLAQGGAAMGMQVHVFVTGFALLGFTRVHHDLPFPSEFASMAPEIAKGLAASNVPSWDTMLHQAKELGGRISACSMMSGVMGLTKDDYGDLIDDVVGVATFLDTAEGGQTYFI